MLTFESSQHCSLAPNVADCEVPQTLPTLLSVACQRAGAEVASAAAHAYERTAVPAGRGVPVGHLCPCAQVRCSLNRASLRCACCWSRCDARMSCCMPEEPVFGSWACLLCVHACAHTRAPRPGGMSRGCSWCLPGLSTGRRAPACGWCLHGRSTGRHWPACHQVPHVGQRLHVCVP